MTQGIEVSLHELRRACDLLIAHVERLGGTVSVEHDFYWDVPAESLYDVDVEPVELTIGQVSESWGQVQQMLADDSRVVSYGLVWLADVLRAVGHHSTG
jgi:hypothetical protein